MREIFIPQNLINRMAAHVADVFPEEGCGLLAGRRDHALEVVSIENILHSPVRFQMDPREQIRHMVRFSENGWDLLGIFHSHPRGIPYPSQTDITEAGYPEAVHLIWGRNQNNWHYRGYHIREDYVEKIEIIPTH